MRLPRLHLFEFEDQAWCPRIVRDQATDCLHFLESSFDVYAPAVPKLEMVLRRTAAGRILDLCSGGSGPILGVQRALAHAGVPVPVLLSDKFPNLPAFQDAVQRSGGAVQFVRAPVDATAVPPDLDGVRTLFSAVHHFRPQEVGRLLADAVRGRRSVAIFDLAARSPAMLLSALILFPVLMLAITPFVRPFRWSRLFWTYLVPAVPVVFWWDGVVSQLRAYSAEELLALARNVAASDYAWEAGTLAVRTAPGRMTYLIGYPLPTAPRGPSRS